MSRSHGAARTETFESVTLGHIRGHGCRIFQESRSRYRLNLDTLRLVSPVAIGGALLARYLTAILRPARVIERDLALPVWQIR
jgi:hypothetical protein